MTGLTIKRGDEMKKGSRVSDRIATRQTALLCFEEATFSVTLLDFGLEGFGLLSDRSVAKGESVLLELSDGGEIDRYYCFVSFCRKEADQFHIGLKITDREEDVVVL